MKDKKKDKTTKPAKKDLKAKNLKYNIMYFPMEMDEDMMDHVIERHRKKTMVRKNNEEKVVEKIINGF